MAEVKVRQLDDQVLLALKARAAGRGVSLEEEIRQTLSQSVADRIDAFKRRAAAIRKLSRPPRTRALDSARLIRRERDANG